MGVEGRAKVGQTGGHGGPPVLEAGKIVRIPLADLHAFLEEHGLEIVGRLSGPDAQRLVVKLAPVGTRGERAGASPAPTE